MKNQQPLLYNLSIERFHREGDVFLIECAAPELTNELAFRKVTKQSLLTWLSADDDGLIEIEDSEGEHICDLTFDEWIQQNEPFEFILRDYLNEKEVRVKIPKVPNGEGLKEINRLHHLSSDLARRMADMNTYIALRKTEDIDTLDLEHMNTKLWQEYLVIEAKIINLQKSRK